MFSVDRWTIVIVPFALYNSRSAWENGLAAQNDGTPIRRVHYSYSVVMPRILHVKGKSERKHNDQRKSLVCLYQKNNNKYCDARSHSETFDFAHFFTRSNWISDSLIWNLLTNDFDIIFACSVCIPARRLETYTNQILDCHRFNRCWCNGQWTIYCKLCNL